MRVDSAGFGGGDIFGAAGGSTRLILLRLLLSSSLRRISLGGSAFGGWIVAARDVMGGIGGLAIFDGVVGGFWSSTGLTDGGAILAGWIP